MRKYCFATLYPFAKPQQPVLALPRRNRIAYCELVLFAKRRRAKFDKEEGKKGKTITNYRASHCLHQWNNSAGRNDLAEAVGLLRLLAEYRIGKCCFDLAVSIRPDCLPPQKKKYEA